MLKRPVWEFEIGLDLFETILGNRVVSLKPIVLSSTVDSWTHGIELGLTNERWKDTVTKRIRLSFAEWKVFLKYFAINPGSSLATLTSLGYQAWDKLRDIRRFDNKHKEMLKEYERLKKIFEE